jgi:hypothetical protein
MSARRRELAHPSPTLDGGGAIWHYDWRLPGGVAERLNAPVLKLVSAAIESEREDRPD